MINSDDFAKRLKQRRLAMGFSQSELGRLSGLAPAQISRYESGVNIPRDDIAAKLASALYTDLEWLTSGVSEATNSSPSGKSADLSGADLTRANLSNANLTGVNLKYTNLTNANLSNANLTNALLIGANLTNANLTNAILNKTDLRWLVAGNGKHILMLQTGVSPIIYTSQEMAIGEWQFSLSVWFADDSNVKDKMKPDHLQWWISHKNLIEEWIQAFPAEPTQKNL